jgi:hypothetical protein
MSADNTRKSFFDNAPTLYIQTGADKSQLFGINFARNVKNRFALRITGGCGLMSPQDAIGMSNMREALSGLSERNDGIKHPQFSGFCLFGGTRMLNRYDPSVIVPGVTEIPPYLSEVCPDVITLGILAKVGHLRYTPNGTVISDEPDSEYVTIIHPTQSSVVLLQPSSDICASWDDEFKESIRICDALRPLNWKGLLFVYNGGGVTEREIKSWAKLGQTDPFWQVLLVRGSGRKADEYANDKEFLEENPTVHVCENTVEDMRCKLSELGAISMPETTSTQITSAEPIRDRGIAQVAARTRWSRR